ncbi:hypothetical protein [Candidatus Uabimicrobium sp. HlEnr_7]|uniref:hypothetical protein n=1 Tax=Candidatus Uabimicrobium helgolandensis TaxID=3095367 RepID=UPI0035575018
MSEKAKQSKCKANLSQFGKGYTIYLLDIGKQVQYPEKSGQGFILSLYNSKILIEPEVYICPSAEEHHLSLEEIKEEFTSYPDKGDANGPVSYAGRKNANQNVYPGIFNLLEDVTTTPIASDDIGESHNHENGTVINFLFLDGHVDHDRENLNFHGDLKKQLDVLAN